MLYVFYPSDVLLSVRLSVTLSVTSRSSIETDERIELVFSIWVSFHLYSVCCNEIQAGLSAKIRYFPPKFYLKLGI